jgi:hypothetical protein
MPGATLHRISLMARLNQSLPDRRWISAGAGDCSCASCDVQGRTNVAVGRMPGATARDIRTFVASAILLRSKVQGSPSWRTRSTRLVSPLCSRRSCASVRPRHSHVPVQPSLLCIRASATFARPCAAKKTAWAFQRMPCEFCTSVLISCRY